MQQSDQWVYPRGALRRDAAESVVDSSISGWRHTGIRIIELGDSTEHALEASDVERMIVPLSGAVTVVWQHSGNPAGAAHGDSVSGTIELAGRSSVFDGPTDVCYTGISTAVTLRGCGRVAIAEAPATEFKPVRYLSRERVPVEIRGAGRSTRQVHNFGVPGVLDAQKLIVCEVITPAENWSSYPAHKHDEHVPGVESRLEEIYYFEAAVARGLEAPEAAEPFGMFATYPSPGGKIVTNALVRTGDIVLVPYGYHGPAVAAPGYDLYYLNVMAGPEPERTWQISDDPAHSWIRSSWAEQAPDPRLPYSPHEGTTAP